MQTIHWTRITDPVNDLNRSCDLLPGSPTKKAIVTGVPKSFWETCNSPCDLPDGAELMETTASSEEDVQNATDVGGVIVRYAALPTPGQQ